VLRSRCCRTVCSSSKRDIERNALPQSLFHGTADTISHFAVQPIGITGDALDDSYSRDRFAAVWVSLKQQFPLLGAQLREYDDGDAVDFVVDESRLGTLHDDFSFADAVSADAVDAQIEAFLNGPRRLSNNMLAHLAVLRERDAGGAGGAPVFHIVFLVAHLITDGMANNTLGRVFLERLAGPARGMPPPDLSARLAMVVAPEPLMPPRALRPARQRWRRAIARVLWANTQGKIGGGHTLPSRATPRTGLTPARSRVLVVTLPERESAAIVRACRAQGVTFGHAYPVISQLAASRVLHRRYLRGELSAAEWAHRLRQPSHSGGPLNLRPFLTPEWLAAGGANEVNLCIAFFFNTLPFMPRAPGAASGDPTRIARDASGAPPLADLLSPARFFARAQIVKRQTNAFVRHPLFLELTLARAPGRAARVRDTLRLWRAAEAGEPVELPPPPPGAMVFQNGGSSFGSVRRVCPAVWHSADVGPGGPHTPARVPKHTPRAARVRGRWRRWPKCACAPACPGVRGAIPGPAAPKLALAPPLPAYRALPRRVDVTRADVVLYLFR
jgi:hypothetical protein